MRRAEFPAHATDHGVMYGAIEFIRRRRNQASNSRRMMCFRQPAGEKSASAGKSQQLPGPFAQNQTAKNLVRLVSDASEGYYYKPRGQGDPEVTRMFDRPLRMSSQRSPHSSNMTNFLKVMRWTGFDKFGRSFYLELQNHGIPEQQLVNRHLIQWAKEFNFNGGYQRCPLHQERALACARFVDLYRHPVPPQRYQTHVLRARTVLPPQCRGNDRIVQGGTLGRFQHIGCRRKM